MLPSRRSKGALAPPALASGMLAAAFGAAVALPAVDAAAQVRPAGGCSKRAVMIDKLKRDYGEVRRGAGLQSNTGVVELFVGEHGTWTLLLTLPNGMSCPVAAGDAWEEDKVAFESKGETPI